MNTVYRCINNSLIDTSLWFDDLQIYFNTIQKSPVSLYMAIIILIMFYKLYVDY